MSTGRGIAVANIESVKHGIEKDSWIVARGVRSTVKSSSGNRVMHECFVFGPDHEELAKNVALKLFGDGETLPPARPSEVSPEMLRSVKRHSKTVSLASKFMDKFCKEWREIVSAPVLSGAESTEPDDSEVSLPSPTKPRDTPRPEPISLVGYTVKKLPVARNGTVATINGIIETENDHIAVVRAEEDGELYEFIIDAVKP